MSVVIVKFGGTQGREGDIKGRFYGPWDSCEEKKEGQEGFSSVWLAFGLEANLTRGKLSTGKRRART